MIGITVFFCECHIECYLSKKGEITNTIFLEVIN